MGKPTVEGHDLTRLDDGDFDPRGMPSYEPPTLAVDTGTRSPGLLCYGVVEGANGCYRAAFEGATYDRGTATFTVRTGVERNHREACDGGITTDIYRLWLALSDPALPRYVRLAQRSYDRTRTSEWGPFDCR